LLTAQNRTSRTATIGLLVIAIGRLDHFSVAVGEDWLLNGLGLVDSNLTAIIFNCFCLNGRYGN